MRVRLICWNEALAGERVAGLKGSGLEIDPTPVRPSGILRELRDAKPEVVLIDLDHLPSHGREVAAALRQSPATRHIPIVFGGGAAEKVERIRQELPDAVYAAWNKITPALKKAAAHPPAAPVKPVAHMERYKGTSLLGKLGVKPKTRVALISPPEEFEAAIGEWPEGVTFVPRWTARAGLAIWFVRSRRELEAVADQLGVELPKGISVWICYPKRAGRYKVDLNETIVRAACLAAGLVAYKICSVDADWSGMKFTRKKTTAG